MTTLQFPVRGGKYGLDISATWSSGNAEPEKLALDGSTWLNVGSAVSSNGTSTYDLAPGQYRIAISLASAVYASLTSILET